MGTIHVTAERAIPAPAPTVYGYLADLHDHHRFLPPAFSDFTIEQGGVGAGSVVSFSVTAGGRTRKYKMTVSEPAPATLVETDALSSLVTTFTVVPKGDAASSVTISTTWQGAGGVGGFFERRFAPKVMRSLYEDELSRLATFAEERAAEEAKVDEAGEESFPASDPPAF